MNRGFWIGGVLGVLAFLIRGPQRVEPEEFKWLLFLLTLAAITVAILVWEDWSRRK